VSVRVRSGLGQVTAVIRDGVVSLDFIDAPAFERFSALSGVTFGQLAERTGVPVGLLMRIREVTGSVAPQPEDRVRDDELACAEMIAAQVKAGFRETAMLQLLRAQSDGTRRMAETESAMWQSEVIGPAMEAGKRPDEILGVDLGDQMSALTERSVIAMYHLQQTRAWTANIIEGFEMMLAAAGLHSRLMHPPAMCFLDISGYTRLTEERGDEAARDLATSLGQIVRRASAQHGGRTVKWLGDGVMFHFPEPPRGVVACLEMSHGVVSAGLPPAHVGMSAGPVLAQGGDYFGRTVNVASRIAGYARQGEVLVSAEVVEAASSLVGSVAFEPIGPVELKGLSGAMDLYRAVSASSG